MPNKKKTKTDVEKIIGGWTEDEKDLDEKDHLSPAYINKIISISQNSYILRKLSDRYLLPEYKKTPSYKKKAKLWEDTLKKYLGDDHPEISNIMLERVDDFIKPGTKGAIRGKKFNEIIQQLLEDEFGEDENYEIQVEKQFTKFPQSENPDWYVHNKITDKVVIGFNQTDLWGGGAQTNRAASYILKPDIHKEEKNNCKRLAVVCNIPPKPINKNKSNGEINKKYRIFNKGFIRKRMCYPDQVINHIREFLDPDPDPNIDEEVSELMSELGLESKDISSESSSKIKDLSSESSSEKIKDDNNIE